MFFTLYDIEEGSFQEKTIQNMFRIGKKEEEKIRPLVVKFLDEETKTKYLKESRDPAFEEDGEEERIYVSQDMTKNQRTKYKKLVAELKARRGRGEKDIAIRDYQTVKRNFRKEDEKTEDGPPVRVSYRSLFVPK